LTRCCTPHVSKNWRKVVGSSAARFRSRARARVSRMRKRVSAPSGIMLILVERFLSDRGSRPVASRPTGSSSRGARVTRSIVALSSSRLRRFSIDGHALLVIIAPTGPAAEHGVARTTRRYVVSTGVRINTLVCPNNTKVAEGPRSIRFSVGSDVPLSPSRWGDYAGADYASSFLRSVQEHDTQPEPPSAIIPSASGTRRSFLAFIASRPAICRVQSGLSRLLARKDASSMPSHSPGE